MQAGCLPSASDRGGYSLASSSSSKPAAPARLQVERGARARRLVLRGQALVGRHGIESPLRAQPAEPAVADGHVADLVAQDDVEDLAGAPVARAHELGLDRRGGIEPARLQRARHEGYAREHVVPRLLRHLPQRVVRGEVAVGEAQRAQVIAQQLEVERLLACHLQPVAMERLGQAGEAPCGVEREVDRVELDVRERMQQRGPALGRAHRALGELRVRHQHGPRGPARDGSGRAVAGVRRRQHVVRPDLPLDGQRSDARRLRVGIGAEQEGEGLAPQRGHAGILVAPEGGPCRQGPPGPVSSCSSARRRSCADAGSTPAPRSGSRGAG
jgi:hypothetical protein